MIRHLVRRCGWCKNPVFLDQDTETGRISNLVNCRMVNLAEKAKSHKVVKCLHTKDKLSGKQECQSYMQVRCKEWKEFIP